MFGVGGLLLSLIVFPLHRVFIHDVSSRRQRARFIVHQSFRFFIKMMQYVGVINFDFPKAATLTDTRGKILVSNHPTLIDVVSLISLIPHADCVVKAQLFKNPFMRGVIQSTGYITNSDPEGLLEDCAESLRRGSTLIIFPEGTRTKPGKTIELQRGAANMAIRTGSNLAVCVLSCKPSTLTKNEPWYHIPKIRPTLTVRLVRDWSIDSYNENSSHAARRLTRDLELFFNQVNIENGTVKSRIETADYQQS